MAGIDTNLIIGGTTAGKSVEAKNDLVNKDVFLRILTAELTHQDPLNAKDNTEYISQLAQFTSLEQTQNLNNSISKLLSSQRMTEGAALIGREVEFSLGDDSTIKDVVKTVRLDGTDIYLTTANGGRYKIDQVLEVHDYALYNGNTEGTQNTSIDTLDQSSEQTQVGDVQVDQQSTEQSQA